MKEEHALAWWARSILIGALIAACLLPIGALGSRFGIWGFTMGFLLGGVGTAVAAIGLVQLRRLDELVERRRDRAADYAKAFAAVPGVTVPSDPPYGTTNYQSYALRIRAGAAADRDEVIEALLAQDIASKPALSAAHHEPAFQGHPHGPLPVTEQIHRDGLLLPLFHEMTDEQLERVVEGVTRAVGL